MHDTIAEYLNTVEDDLISRREACKMLYELEEKIAFEEGWQEKCDGVFQSKELIKNMPGIRKAN